MAKQTLEGDAIPEAFRFTYKVETDYGDKPPEVIKSTVVRLSPKFVYEKDGKWNWTRQRDRATVHFDEVSAVKAFLGRQSNSLRIQRDDVRKLERHIGWAVKKLER